MRCGVGGAPTLLRSAYPVRRRLKISPEKAISFLLRNAKQCTTAARPSGAFLDEPATRDHHWCSVRRNMPVSNLCTTLWFQLVILVRFLAGISSYDANVLL